MIPCAHCRNTYLHAVHCPNPEPLPKFAASPGSRALTNRWVDITGDLQATFMLLDRADAIYFGPGDAVTNAAVATLMHACDYLRDRIGYEMEPSPTGMIRLIFPSEPEAGSIEVLVREEDLEGAW